MYLSHCPIAVWSYYSVKQEAAKLLFRFDSWKKLSYQGTITKNEKTEQEIFYAFYQDNLFPYLTVYQNLNMFLTNREMKEAEFYFNKFELMYLLHRKAALLSGGELQKSI